MKRDQFSQKVGRNDPCPCGSGKKFKKCHGAVTRSKSPNAIDPKIVKREFDKIRAVEQQRQKQQGLGRPIISEVINGCRVVGVGGEVLASPSWKTFHDFLSDYIKMVLGEEWGTNELKKPVHERHPLMTWYERAEIFWNSVIKERGRVHRAAGTGAVMGVLGLAYNLYLLAHNAELQELLVRRLKNRDNFFGAYYETSVAGALIKAGFDIEFEDETDSTTSHCEFTAVCRATGRKFSVEAKARGPNKASAGVGKQLIRALKKRALHTRVIFIEANVKDDGSEVQTKQALGQILASLRNWEPKLVIDNQPAPPAYIIITNNPFHYDLDGPNRRWALGEGFKIPDFKLGAQFASLRDAIKSREKHIEMFNLMQSLAEHDNIPSTFDGEIPDLAFSQTATRLLVGQKYIVPGHEGKEVVAVLVDGVVMEKQKSASCVMELPDKRHLIVDFPLSEDELNAYKKHPDTFFGVVKSPTGKIKDPLDLFDFFFKGYGQTSKERLLELMKDAADLEHLKKLSQEEVAFTYCERLVYGVMQMGSSPRQGVVPIPTSAGPQ